MSHSRYWLVLVGLWWCRLQLTFSDKQISGSTNQPRRTESDRIYLYDKTAFYDYQYQQQNLHGCTNLTQALRPENRQPLTQKLAAPCRDYLEAARNTSYVVHYDFCKKSQNASIRSSSCGVTLISQFSANHTRGLERIAHNWLGPISIAFYASTVEAGKFKLEIAKSRQLSNRSNIVYHHVKRAVDDSHYDYVKRRPFYPINFLRNVALHSVQTPFVFNIDIDFVPRSGLYESLVRHYLPKITECDKINNKNAYRKKQKNFAIVVAAFMANAASGEIAWKLLPVDKQSLLRLWPRNPLLMSTIKPSLWMGYFRAQNETNYERWRKASAPYAIRWKKSYEPFFVVRKRGFPLYNSHLMWPYYDKASNTLELVLNNYTFVVLPDEFIVHLPHASESSEPTKWQGICRVHLEEQFYQRMIRKYTPNSAKRTVNAIASYCFAVPEINNTCLCAGN